MDILIKGLKAAAKIRNLAKRTGETLADAKTATVSAWQS
jgi:hypothetical protein